MVIVSRLARASGRGTRAATVLGSGLLFAALAAAVPAIGARTTSAAPPLPPVNARARGSFSSILMWHDVVAKTKEVWFDTTVAELKQQFASIRSHHLTPITMERLAEHLEKGTAVPPGSVVLTFDDNNVGLYRYAFPLLKQYRWPATFFVHTDYVGKKTGKEHNTWEQLREMERSGLVKAEPHTASHPSDLRTVSDRQLQRELVGARQTMEKELGGARPFFAYPEGHYNQQVAEKVLRAGYRLAITEDHGSAESSPNLMMVHRFSMHRWPVQAIAETARAMRRGSHSTR